MKIVAFAFGIESQILKVSTAESRHHGEFYRRVTLRLEPGWNGAKMVDYRFFYFQFYILHFKL